MPHGPEHHIEHAEHAAHVHDPFEKRVTLSIAIVAAVLACVTMFGHRAHNETLRLQGEALSHQIEAGIHHAQASNQWAFYQAQNIRSHQYTAFLELADIMPAGSGDAKRTKVTERWQGQVAKYEKNLPEIQKEAKSETEEGKAAEKKAKAALDESHLVHLKADRFDYGELGVELALVLCSMAVLTKQRGFWYVGLLAGLTGVAVALSGFFAGHH